MNGRRRFFSHLNRHEIFQVEIPASVCAYAQGCALNDEPVLLIARGGGGGERGEEEKLGHRGRARAFSLGEVEPEEENWSSPVPGVIGGNFGGSGAAVCRRKRVGKRFILVVATKHEPDRGRSFTNFLTDLIHYWLIFSRALKREGRF